MHIRQHGHRAVGHRAYEVDGQAFVETGPSFSHDHLPRGVYDTARWNGLQHPIGRHVDDERPTLCLKSRAYNFMWVRSD